MADQKSTDQQPPPPHRHDKIQAVGADELERLRAQIPAGVNDLFAECVACRAIIRTGGAVRKGRFNTAVRDFGWGGAPCGFTCAGCGAQACARHLRQSKSVPTQLEFLTATDADRKRLVQERLAWSRQLRVGDFTLSGYCAPCVQAALNVRVASTDQGATKTQDTHTDK